MTAKKVAIGITKSTVVWDNAGKEWRCSDFCEFSIVILCGSKACKNHLPKEHFIQAESERQRRKC